MGRQNDKAALREVRRINSDLGFEALKNAGKRVANLHGNIAGDVWPNGAVLECDECRRTESIDSATAAHYLAHGWPKCCGHTMKLTPKDKGPAGA